MILKEKMAVKKIEGMKVEREKGGILLGDNGRMDTHLLFIQ